MSKNRLRTSENRPTSFAIQPLEHYCNRFAISRDKRFRDSQLKTVVLYFWHLEQ
jgi:hypothetical protein